MSQSVHFYVCRGDGTVEEIRRKIFGEYLIEYCTIFGEPKPEHKSRRVLENEFFHIPVGKHKVDI